MKFVEENNEKIFTKNYGKDIIKKKYTPLNKDKGFYEMEGLHMHMKETKDVRLNVLAQKKYIDGKVLKCFKNICSYYNKNFKEIEEYLENKKA